MASKYWEMKITKVQNGYKLLIPKEDEDHIDTEIVIEEPATEFGELESGQRMLWEIMEHFALLGSKHDKKRLIIDIREQKDE